MVKKWKECFLVVREPLKTLLMKFTKGDFDSQVDSVYFALKNSSAIELLKQQGCEVILPSDFEMQDSLVEFTLDDLNCYHLQQTGAGDIIIPISL